MDNQLKPVDHAALKVNQAAIILLSILAFILNAPWLAAGVAGVMLIGALLGLPGFLPLYRSILRPLRLVKPDLLLDNPEPHRFAQGLGGVFLAVGCIFIFAGYALPGWILVWLVIALAALNLFAGFCVGCAVYYWFNRLGLPGFTRRPPLGTFPGMRPHSGGPHGA